jgi:hypothetical protein
MMHIRGQQIGGKMIFHMSRYISRINPMIALTFTLSGTVVGALAARSYLGPIIPVVKQLRANTTLVAIRQTKGDFISAEDVSNIDTIETIL